MMKIKLGNKGYALIDDEDHELVRHCAWYLYKDNCNQYARNKNHQSMHRVIMNAKSGQVVDHKDGDGLNNQKNNLRLCTQAQNLANRRVGRKQSSKFLGVSKNRKWWVATCRKDGVLHRKWVKTEEDAALAYNELAIKHHGEFARINKIVAIVS